MKTNPTRWSAKALALCGITLLMAAAPASAVFINPDLGTTTSYEGWDDLTASRLGSEDYGAYMNPVAPWPNIAPNTAGSDGMAEFTKTTGDAYPANASIYLFGPSTFEVNSTSTISGLETIVFQLDMSDAGGGFTAAPVLNYNGGSQALTTGYTAIGAGSYDAQGTPTNNFAFQWDLSGIAEPITSYSITWTQAGHSPIYALQLNTGDTFNAATAVPEPSSLALVGLLGGAAMAWRRRKSS